MPTALLNYTSWSFSSHAILRSGSSPASRTGLPGPPHRGTELLPSAAETLPARSRSFPSLLSLPCFTLVKENCFDCIFLVDIKCLSKQDQSPQSCDSAHQDNGSGWARFPRRRRGAAPPCHGGVSPGVVTAQHVPSFQGKEQTLRALLSLHTCGNGWPR